MISQLYPRLTQRRKKQIWYVPFLILSTGLMFFRLLFLAKIFSVENFGFYSFGLLISGFYYIISDMGFKNILQREQPTLLLKGKEIESFTLTLQCAGVIFFSAITIFILILASKYLNLISYDTYLLIASLINGLSLQLFFIVNMEDRNRGELLLSSKHNFYRTFAASIFTILTAIILDSPILALLTEALISFIFALIILLKNAKKIPQSFKIIIKASFKKPSTYRIKASLVFFIITISGYFFINIDRWLAANLLSPKEFSIYSFAWIVISISLSIQSIVNSALYPALVRKLLIDGIIKTYTFIEKISKYYAIIAIVIILPSWIILQYVIKTWFIEYESSIELLKFFIITSFFLVANFWNIFLTALKKENSILIMNLLMLGLLFTILTHLKIDLSKNSLALLGLLFSVISYMTSYFLSSYHFSISKKAINLIK